MPSENYKPKRPDLSKPKGSSPQTVRRHGKANPAKSAVTRKVLIACWHVLSLQQPFKPPTPVSAEICPGKLPDDLAA